MINTKNLILFFLLLSLNVKGQDSWQLLNPKPSSSTGLDIEFVSETKGYYITNQELFYTLDTGVQWSLKRNISGGKDLSFKDNLGIIVGAYGTVYISSDMGDSWSTTNVGSNEWLNTVTIIDENTIVVSSNNSIFISNNKGADWQQQNIPSIWVNKTFFLTANIGHAVTENGEIFKTIDGGINWVTTASFVNYSPNSFFTIYFKNENVGFATREHDEFYKTTDGGDTWVEIDEGISHAILSFQFIDDMIGFGAGEYGMYKTIDGGDNWTRIAIENAFYYASDMYGIYFLNENIGFSVGQRGRIAKTTDSGENWELYSPINNDVSQVGYLSPTRTIARVGSDFFASSDKGISWDYLSTPRIGSYTSNFDFVDANIGYCIAGGSVGTSSRARSIYKTTDGGATWVQPTNFGLNVDPAIYSLEFVNENLGFASGGFNQKRTFKTTDGGEVWRVVLQEAMGQIQFLNSEIGYARRIGYSTDIVYKTIDGGENWVEIFSSELDIGAFYFIDPELGYMVGDDGLAFKTVDGGDTWIELDLPYLDFEHLVFHTELIGYAVDDYGVILKTENGGYTWSQIYQNYEINDIIITPGDEIFIAGNYGRILKSQVITEDVSLVVKKATNISVSGASLETIVAANGNEANNVQLQYGENGNFNNSIELTDIIQIGELATYTSVLSSLKANTEYNYRAVAFSDDIEIKSEVGSFTTLPSYIFNMDFIFNPGTTNATLVGHIVANDLSISNIEFQYGLEPNSFDNNLTSSITTVNATGENINLEGIAENLEPDTTYYVRLKANHGTESIYSNTVSFKTKPNYIITNTSPYFLDSQVNLSADIYTNNGEITDLVFEYGNKSFTNEAVTDVNTIQPSFGQRVSATINNLEENVTYFYRIRGNQGGNVIYGPEGIFSLTDTVFLELGEEIIVKRESVELNGRVYSQGGNLINIQIEYGTTLDFGNLQYVTPSAILSGSTRNIHAELQYLIPNTLYYYRLKATQNDIVYYSEHRQFISGEKLPSDNFKIVTTSETCVDKNNGTIMIASEIISNFVVDIDNTSYSFTDEILIENLSPGIYYFCITEMDAITSSCYSFEVSSSELVTGKSYVYESNFGKSVDVNMEKGTMPYTVKINDNQEKIFNTTNFSFYVNEGDKVLVSSKNECEGTLEINIPLNTTADLFVNPIEELVEISVMENHIYLMIQIFDINGSLLNSFTEYVDNNKIAIDLKNYSSGIYFLKINGDNIRTHKLIKK